jgi:hypothetical protein
MGRYFALDEKRGRAGRIGWKEGDPPGGSLVFLRRVKPDAHENIENLVPVIDTVVWPDARSSGRIPAPNRFRPRLSSSLHFERWGSLQSLFSSFIKSQLPFARPISFHDKQPAVFSPNVRVSDFLAIRRPSRIVCAASRKLFDIATICIHDVNLWW